MALWLFRTPIRNPQGPRVPTVPNPTTEFNDNTPESYALMRHFRHHSGYPVAVLVDDPCTVTEVAVPTVDQMQAADHVFMGGRDNLISDPAVAACLMSNGYTLIELDAPLPGTGLFPALDLFPSEIVYPEV